MSVDINIDTICNICGKEVEVHYMSYELLITPCDSCLDDKYREGFDEGEKKGIDQ